MALNVVFGERNLRRLPSRMRKVGLAAKTGPKVAVQELVNL